MEQCKKRPYLTNAGEEQGRETLPPRKRVKAFIINHEDEQSAIPSGEPSQPASLEFSNLEDSGSFNSFSDKAKKMMLSMGFEKGKGLGKFKQGIVQPVPTSNQRGRRGLGFLIEGLEPKENIVWDSSKEHISAAEEVRWCPISRVDLPTLTELKKWPITGSPLKEIKDQIEFCHPKILEGVLQSKTIFDMLSEKELHWARFRSNPFETIGKVFFQNRAALKMANLDKVFDFMFTNPVDENMRSLIVPNELLYFADVCAAPGGFSEYVLWRKKTQMKGFCDAKGFGFTLRENDFRLHDFFAASPEYFEPHYGGSGVEGTGDVYEPQNIVNFCNFVLKSTHNKGVHFMMADGGFSVEGQENIQEILSKQLYLCQFIVALGIVREGGHFVCKLFDLFTPFSIGLIYIMSKCFKQISIHKPNTSRPANSERYIICKWKKTETSQRAYEYLFHINIKIKEFKSLGEDEDVLEIVPFEIFKDDPEFCQYIYDSNNQLGSRQIVSLQKIRAFCQDTTLTEDLQTEMRTQCLDLWDIPDKPRVAPSTRTDPKLKIKELLSFQVAESLANGPPDLKRGNQDEIIHSPYDFRFVFIAASKLNCKERGFFIGMGGKNVYVWSGKMTHTIQRTELGIHLPSDTIIYGEIVTELRGEGKAQMRLRALHLIDAFVLNGFNLSSMHLVERHNHLRKFAAAINKESRADILPIRCKPLYKLEEIQKNLAEPLLTWRFLKVGRASRKLVYLESEPKNGDPARFTVPTGIMLLKITKDPWMMAYSKSHQRKYWYNTINRASTFDCLNEVISPSSDTYTKAAVWNWSAIQPACNSVQPDDVTVNPDHGDEILSFGEFVQYIKDKL